MASIKNENNIAPKRTWLILIGVVCLLNSSVYSKKSTFYALHQTQFLTSILQLTDTNINYERYLDLHALNCNHELESMKEGIILSKY